MITLGAIVSEAQERGLSASLEYPGFAAITDPCGRVLHIGTANGTWGVDVFATARRAENGEAPRESDTLTGDTAPMLVAHALAVANRVPITYADRAYGSAAEQRKADRAESGARNRR